MAFKIINRFVGDYLILPSGEKVNRGGFSVVEEITTGLQQMQKKGHITIHEMFTHNSNLPELPKEGACYINGDRSYKFTKGSWEEKEVKPPLLPVALQDGFQLHTDDRIYERQGRDWVVLGGRNSAVSTKSKELGELAASRLEALEKSKAKFYVSPLTEETLFMIDITGINLLKFAKDAYDITPRTGKAAMLGQNNGYLTDEQAQDLIDKCSDDDQIALDMQRVYGKDCKMRVYRNGDSLLIEANWLNHTMEDLKELLNRHNINF